MTKVYFFLLCVYIMLLPSKRFLWNCMRLLFVDIPRTPCSLSQPFWYINHFPQIMSSFSRVFVQIYLTIFWMWLHQLNCQQHSLYPLRGREVRHFMFIYKFCILTPSQLKQIKYISFVLGIYDSWSGRLRNWWTAFPLLPLVSRIKLPLSRATWLPSIPSWSPLLMKTYSRGLNWLRSLMVAWMSHKSTFWGWWIMVKVMLQCQHFQDWVRKWLRIGQEMTKNEQEMTQN